MEVTVQKIPQTAAKQTKRDVYARVAYYYPQYTLEQIEKMSVRDIKLLLKTANKIEANKMQQLLSIALAPNQKDNSKIKDLSNYYQDIIDG